MTHLMMATTTKTTTTAAAATTTTIAMPTTSPETSGERSSSFKSASSSGGGYSTDFSSNRVQSEEPQPEKAVDFLRLPPPFAAVGRGDDGEATTGRTIIATGGNGDKRAVVRFPSSRRRRERIVGSVPPLSVLTDEDRSRLFYAVDEGAAAAALIESREKGKKTSSAADGAVGAVLREQCRQRSRGSSRDETRLYFASSRRSEEDRAEAAARGEGTAEEVREFVLEWLRGDSGSGSGGRRRRSKKKSESTMGGKHKKDSGKTPAGKTHDRKDTKGRRQRQEEEDGSPSGTEKIAGRGVVTNATRGLASKATSTRASTSITELGKRRESRRRSSKSSQNSEASATTTSTAFSSIGSLSFCWSEEDDEPQEGGGAFVREEQATRAGRGILHRFRRHEDLTTDDEDEDEDEEGIVASSAAAAVYVLPVESFSCLLSTTPTTPPHRRRDEEEQEQDEEGIPPSILSSSPQDQPPCFPDAEEVLPPFLVEVHRRMSCRVPNRAAADLEKKKNNERTEKRRSAPPAVLAPKAEIAAEAVVDQKKRAGLGEKQKSAPPAVLAPEAELASAKAVGGCSASDTGRLPLLPRISDSGGNAADGATTAATATAKLTDALAALRGLQRKSTTPAVA